MRTQHSSLRMFKVSVYQLEDLFRELKFIHEVCCCKMLVLHSCRLPSLFRYARIASHYKLPNQFSVGADSLSALLCVWPSWSISCELQTLFVEDERVRLVLASCSSSSLVGDRRAVADVMSPYKTFSSLSVSSALVACKFPFLMHAFLASIVSSSFFWKFPVSVKQFSSANYQQHIACYCKTLSLSMAYKYLHFSTCTLKFYISYSPATLLQSTRNGLCFMVTDVFIPFGPANVFQLAFIPATYMCSCWSWDESKWATCSWL